MAGRKTKGFFWRGVLLLLSGYTLGMASAAAIAFYANKLYLPLIETPTRQPLLPEQSDTGNEDFFEFHERLRQQQVVPLEEVEESAPVQQQFVYYLQIAAFSDSARAEAEKAKLVLIGQDAEVRSAGGEAGYRVWMGPYDSAAKAERVRADLTLQGYEGMSVLKVAQ